MEANAEKVCAEEEWDELVLRHAARLRRRVRQTLRRAGVPARADQVEELVQEVYCHLIARGLGRLAECRDRSEQVIGCYLGRVAERVVLDQLRAARAQKRGGRCRIERGWAEREMAERMVDPAASAEELLVRRECLQVFVARYRRDGLLPTRCRDALILDLLLLRGCSLIEVAHALGGSLTPRRIESLLDRIRHHLECGHAS